MHYYLYTQVVKGLLLSRKECVRIRIFLLIIASTFFLGEFLSRRFFSVWIKPIVYIGAIWLGIISIALVIFLIRDILRVFFHTQSFRYYSTIIAILVLCIVSSYSIYNGMRKLVIKQITIKNKKLPRQLQEFSIVHLSDLHLNFMKSTRWLEDIVNKTNDMNSDLIVITGDLIDANLCRFEEFCSILQKLNAKYGIFAVTGNHEYYAGVDIFLEIAKLSNIEVLRDKAVTIADAVEFVGIDDITGKRFLETGPDLKKAMKNCNLTKPVILLSHQPDIFDEALKFGVDLQLSGHTHVG